MIQHIRYNRQSRRSRYNDLPGARNSNVDRGHAALQPMTNFSYLQELCQSASRVREKYRVNIER
jgi:hypothetical protein